MGLTIAFWALAVVAVLAALGVVLLRNVFRAALSLILCFLTVAGIYVTLSADFLAAVQVLVYVGAISVLVLTLLNTPWQISNTPALTPTTAPLAIKLFGEGGVVLAVEIAAVLLLSAIVGAIVLAREK